MQAGASRLARGVGPGRLPVPALSVGVLPAGRAPLLHAPVHPQGGHPAGGLARLPLPGSHCLHQAGVCLFATGRCTLPGASGTGKTATSAMAAACRSRKARWPRCPPCSTTSAAWSPGARWAMTCQLCGCDPGSADARWAAAGQQRHDQAVPGGGAVKSTHHAALPVWQPPELPCQLMRCLQPWLPDTAAVLCHLRG